MGVNGISGANAQNGQYYTYENDPQFHHGASFQHVPRIGYMSPTEQDYAAYDGYDQYDTDYAAHQQHQDDDAAYLQYQQQQQQQQQQHLYQSPLQNGQDLNAPVTYFDPRHQDVDDHGVYSDMHSGEIYYPDQTYTVGPGPVSGGAISDNVMQQQQQQHQQQHQQYQQYHQYQQQQQQQHQHQQQADSYGVQRDPMRSSSALMSMVLGANSNSSAETSARSPEENPEYGIISPASMAASRHIADETPASSSSYVDSESHSRNAKSEPWPKHQPSMTSIGSSGGSLSSKRNPQGLVKGSRPRIPLP
ncbi:hypothetical protein BG011_002966 [Mortierella polycephala]|uniref:Uncharacterized protein n=1 Tax=Mortierella polycephala TaxID=41804 RepID=A0A9P6Q277_9FUNG|nr:hypothetical protein BG011_002966 [Mortierella polycephala]